MIIALSLTACLSVSDRGHRAFEAGNYEQALSYYEEEIERGSRDVQLYHRAAKAAMSAGSFASAERYYSLALRYGGGLEVARDLANFYVQTSNYARAVRVFQYLLRYEQDPQPVYNNLGTALMYANLPFDAESYLLIAQQMEPSDPVPYVNLGLLYDRHLKNPVLAVGFYSCFVKMSRDRTQVRSVQTRIQEISQRQIDAPPVQIDCGEPYKPEYRGMEDLRRHFPDSRAAREGKAKGAEPINPDEIIELGLKPGADDDGPQVPPVIEGQVRGVPGVSAPQEARREAVDVARDAFAEGDYDEVVRTLSRLPVDALDAASMALLGRAYVELEKFDEAVGWLEWSIKKEPRRETAAALLRAYERLGRTEGIQNLCARFQSWPEFNDVLESCPSTEEAP